MASSMGFFSLVAILHVDLMRLTFRTYLSFVRYFSSLRVRRRRYCSLMLRLGLLMSRDEPMRILLMLGWHNLGVGCRWSVHDDFMLFSRFGCVMNWRLCMVYWYMMDWCSVVHRGFVMNRSSFR